MNKNKHERKIMIKKVVKFTLICDFGDVNYYEEVFPSKRRQLDLIRRLEMAKNNSSFEFSFLFHFFKCIFNFFFHINCKVFVLII